MGDSGWCGAAEAGSVFWNATKGSERGYGQDARATMGAWALGEAAGRMPEARFGSGWGGFGDFDAEEADVVVEVLGGGEVEDAVEDGVEHGVEGDVAGVGDDFEEAVFEEGFALLVFGFEDAIGEEDDAVDLIEGALADGVGGAADEAESGAFFLSGGGDLGGAAGAAEDGAGVARAGVFEGGGLEVDDAVEGGGEEGGAGAFEDGGEAVVEAAEEGSGVGGL